MISRPLGGALLLTLVACGLAMVWDSDETVEPLSSRHTTAPQPVGEFMRVQPPRKVRVEGGEAVPGMRPEPDAWPEVGPLALAAWSAPAPARPALPAAEPVAVAAITPAAAPPPAAPPPASPVPAPAYELIGVVSEGAAHGALLQGAQRSLWVRTGDTLDADWQVLRVDRQGVELLWLPQRLPARIGYRTPS